MTAYPPAGLYLAAGYVYYPLPKNKLCFWKYKNYKLAYVDFSWTAYFLFYFWRAPVVQLRRIHQAAMMINKCCNQLHLSLFAYRAQCNVFACL